MTNPSYPGTIRRATLSDNQAIVEIFLVAAARDPINAYLFPRDGDGRRSPSRGEVNTRTDLFECWLTDAKRQAFIFEVETIEHPGIVKVVGFGVCKLPSSKLHAVDIGSKQYTPEEEMNLTKGVATGNGFNEQIGVRWYTMNKAVKKVKEEWFKSKYGKNQVYLDSLYVHPDYQGRGIGTQLLKQYLLVARERDLPFALLTSVVSADWYKKRGFLEVGKLTVEVDDHQAALNDTQMIVSGLEMCKSDPGYHVGA